MLYKKVATAFLRPEMKENGLKHFSVALDFPDVNISECNEMNGEWDSGPLGSICKIKINKIADVSIQDVKYGRIFTDLTAPSSYDGITTIKDTASLRFDCGYNTNDIFAEVDTIGNDLKSLDLSCYHPPKKPETGNIFALTPKGMIGVIYPK